VEGAACEHLFVTSQGSAYMRFRRALDRGNVTEALSAASELWEGVGGWGAPTPRRLPGQDRGAKRSAAPRGGPGYQSRRPEPFALGQLRRST
jgi:hypothetical protein